MAPSADLGSLDEVATMLMFQKSLNNGLSASYKCHGNSSDSYETIEEPIHTRRPLRVICLGAGYSGILLGIIWNQRMQNRNAELVIYERNSDLGGTWLENRYQPMPMIQHDHRGLLTIND